MILKAGTILVKNDKIALVYRDYYDDYSFPKGHVEKGESFIECAIRETNEETKREVLLFTKNFFKFDLKNVSIFLKNLILIFPSSNYKI